MQERIASETAALERRWAEEARSRGIRREYTAAEVVRLRGSIRVEYTIARRGAARLWELLQRAEPVRTFGALTGAQAVEMVRGGLEAIYLSGWQVAADGNLAAQTYPDQSLYPSNSVPALVRRLNNALLRADQVEWAENWPGDARRTDGQPGDGRRIEGQPGDGRRIEGQPGDGRRIEGQPDSKWMVPIVADAEAGFGGPLHAFELMKSMIDAGASGVHFEDQLASEKKCGHMGGKVLVPTSQFVRTLAGARLAADVLDVPTLIIARTDALGATLLTSDVDPADRAFAEGDRTTEGYFRVRAGMDSAVARAVAYAPYADLVWCETSKPDLEEAKRFADGVHAKFPGKLLAYNCSPSFNWARNLDAHTIAKFQRELAAMGYRFQFITLAGWHLINYHTFALAHAYAAQGMPAYVELQQAEFAREADGYTATKHQREAGTGYFDEVLTTITGGTAATAALAGSTESEQFGERDEPPRALAS